MYCILGIWVFGSIPSYLWVEFTHVSTNKLKIKKFGAVLRYEFEMIVKHVMMLPGIPNMDIAL